MNYEYYLESIPVLKPEQNYEFIRFFIVRSMCIHLKYLLRLFLH